MIAENDPAQPFEREACHAEENEINGVKEYPIAQLIEDMESVESMLSQAATFTERIRGLSERTSDVSRFAIQVEHRRDASSKMLDVINRQHGIDQIRAICEAESGEFDAATLRKVRGVLAVETELSLISLGAIGTSEFANKWAERRKQPDDGANKAANDGEGDPSTATPQKKGKKPKKRPWGSDAEACAKAFKAATDAGACATLRDHCLEWYDENRDLAEFNLRKGTTLFCVLVSRENRPKWDPENKYNRRPLKAIAEGNPSQP